MTPSSPKPPAFLAWIVAFAAVSGLLLLFLLLPTGDFAAAIILFGVAVMLYAAVRAGANPVRVLRWWFKPRAIAADRPLAWGDRLPRWLALLEIAFLCALAVYFTHEYLTTDDSMKLGGYEGEWLTSSAYTAAQTWQLYGYLPLWQPYLESGEPLPHNPFAFIFNPFSFVPSLLWGAVQGVKVSVTLAAVIATLGGWFLGRVLGFGTVGRLLLGTLLLGKGNMHAMIGTGYFQLGVAQAYFPWVIAGTLATLRLPDKRWPPALLALSFTLMFFAGNLWYMLPTLFTLALLTLTHVLRLQAPRVDWGTLLRMALAGALTVGLSAVTLLPLWADRHEIGGHPDDLTAGAEMAIPLLTAANLPFNPAPQIRWQDTVNNGRIPIFANQFFFSYVAPLWFLTALALVPPLWPWLHRPGARQSWRIWLVALPVWALSTAWGAGATPLFVWLYNTLPGLGQWRFVGRAFAVASFWIAVLLAWRCDSLLRALVPHRPQFRREHPLPAPETRREAATGFRTRLEGWRFYPAVRYTLRLLLYGVIGGALGWLLYALLLAGVPTLGAWSFVGRLIFLLSSLFGLLAGYHRLRPPVLRLLSAHPRYLLALALLLAAANAAYDVVRQWEIFSRPAPVYDEQINDVLCLRWLRLNYPDEPLAVWRMGYDVVYEFMEQRVRLSNIAADYFPIAEAATVGDLNIVEQEGWRAEFAMPVNQNERDFLRDQGYYPVPGMPTRELQSCLWQNPNALPYAYMMPLHRARTLAQPPDSTFVRPIREVAQYPGVVIVAAPPTEGLYQVVAVRERMLDGWTVQVDGQEAQIESFGGQVAVVLPPGDAPHTLVFTYRPPLLLLGGALSLATSVFCAGFLLWRGKKRPPSEPPAAL
ncbi:MAG: hypothetical protein HXY40_08135 [Chloroflexi bacterium]|nr:hypothetical protein [Chloroflexota bacterium]